PEDRVVALAAVQRQRERIPRLAGDPIEPELAVNDERFDIDVRQAVSGAGRSCGSDVDLVNGGGAVEDGDVSTGAAVRMGGGEHRLVQREFVTPGPTIHFDAGDHV